MFFRLAVTCESWRKILISNPQLWTQLDLSGMNEITSEYAFNQLNERDLFRLVSELNLSGWQGAAAERILENLAESSGNPLKSVSLKNCHISLKTLTLIQTKCSNIEFLDFSSITVCITTFYYELI